MAISLHDLDFAAWAEGQAETLRRIAAENPEVAAELDIANLIDEVESMGASVDRELISRLAILLAHLCKWNWQPALRTRSWRNTIDEQRDQVALLLRRNPSRRRLLADLTPDSWTLARRKAHRETGLDLATFPEDCPFTIDQLLAEDWLPE